MFGKRECLIIEYSGRADAPPWDTIAEKRWGYGSDDCEKTSDSVLWGDAVGCGCMQETGTSDWDGAGSGEDQCLLADYERRCGDVDGAGREEGAARGLERVLRDSSDDAGGRYGEAVAGSCVCGIARLYAGAMGAGQESTWRVGSSD